MTDRVPAKEIDDVNDPTTINGPVTQNRFRRFKDGINSLDENLRSRLFSFVIDEVLFEMGRQWPTQTLVDCRQNLAFYKASDALNRKYQIAWNTANS